MNKVTSLSEAVHLVQDRNTIGLGGMTIYRRPVAFARALIARDPQPRELTLLAFTGGLAADMLVGAGLIHRSRTCYFGLEIFGLAPMFTQAVHEGKLQVIEESEASIACGLRATMGGTGFIPSRAWLGTDMLSLRPEIKTIRDPYSGDELVAFPAITCDVAIIHVLRADEEGNAILGGNPTIDLELAMVSQQVIITAEAVERRLEGPIDLPGQTVTAVVHAPRGAWPTSCYPAYPIDGETILNYISACNAGQFWDFVSEAWTTL